MTKEDVVSIIRGRNKNKKRNIIYINIDNAYDELCKLGRIKFDNDKIVDTDKAINIILSLSNDYCKVKEVWYSYNSGYVISSENSVDSNRDHVFIINKCC